MEKKNRFLIMLISLIVMTAMSFAFVGCDKDSEVVGSKPTYKVTIINANPTEPSQPIVEKTSDGKLDFCHDVNVVGHIYRGLFTESGEQYYDGDDNLLVPINSNLTLTCKWEKKKYPIEFYDGTTLLQTASIEYDSVNNVFPETTQVGMECVGWKYASEDFSIILPTEKMALAFNKTNFAYFDFFAATVTKVFAVLEKKNCAIDFCFGENDKQSFVAKYGDPLPTPTAREFVDKKIVGWSLTEGGIDNFVGTVDGDMQLYPIFVSTFQLKCETNGGNAIDTIVAFDGEVMTLPTPTKEHYTFCGWYGNASLTGAQYTNEFVVRNNMTFFADWSATNYELTFHTASTQRPGKKIFSIESVAQIVLPTLDAETANKRSFVGWSFVENDRNNVITSFDPNSNLRNVDLFAVWKGDDVTITTIVDGASSDTIVEFGAIFYIKPPTKAGFSFDGWFDQQVDGTRLSKVSGESLAIVGDNSAKTIYARWVKNVNLTFDALGGKNLSISIRPGANVTYETTTRYKYDTFVGWRCNGVTYTSDFVAPTQDATFVAVWETEYKYISNAQELWAIDADLNTKTDGKYMLTRDIDLSAYNWYGIGNRGSSFKIFTGILDGDGHKIVGFHSGVILQRNDGNSGYWGLFVYTRWATFTDLTLENVNIGLGKDGNSNSFRFYLGALCGVAEDSIFRNVKTSGAVVASWRDGAEVRVGGITGYAEDVKFYDCANSANVVGRVGGAIAGGISGGTKNSYLKNCSNTGYIEAQGMVMFGIAYAGGIAGTKAGNVTFDNCWNSGGLKAHGATGTHKSGDIFGASV